MTPFAKRLYIASVLFAAMPMLAGASLFLLWFATRAGVYVLIGIYALYVSLASVAVSSICLLSFLGINRGGENKLLYFAALPAFLMALNFPVGTAVIGTFCYLQSQYVLDIRNDSSVVVKNIRVVADCEDVLGDLSSGEQITRKYRFLQDGALTFSAQADEKTVQGVVEGYVTNGWGGHKLLVFENNGQYRIVE